MVWYFSKPGRPEIHHYLEEGGMADGKRVRIDLTPKRQQEIGRLTGRSSEFLSFTLSELEHRIAPSTFPPGGGKDPGG